MELMLARAQRARAAVRDGVLGAADALALTVWPTAAIAETEADVPRNTIASRAYSARLNQ